MNNSRLIIFGWIIGTSFLAFLLFAFDKFRAGKSGRRVPEMQLLTVAALGGWLGAFFAMSIFRHKTAKTSFKLKFELAFFVWLGLVSVAVWRS